MIRLTKEENDLFEAAAETEEAEDFSSWARKVLKTRARQVLAKQLAAKGDSNADKV